MNQDPAIATAPSPLERRFEEPIQKWELIFLVALAASILAGSIWQSQKNYLNNDELVTAVVVSNSSLTQMLHVISIGGELNPPLFFIVEWIITHLFGTSELALRAMSMLSTVLAGWVLFFTMRPLTGPRIAALAVAFVLGLSREVFGFAFIARYYAPLFFLVAWGSFLALRYEAGRRWKARHYFLFFLSHLALIYWHLYGLLYSGVILAAMIAADALRGKARWGFYAAVVAAWACFGAWVPSMRNQLHAVSGGVFVPEGLLDVGIFLEQLGMAIPLAPVFLLVLLLGILALVTARPARISEEAGACSAPLGWTACGLMALALISVPVCTWLASHVMHPAPYMWRYNFPIIAGWVYIIALAILAMHRLPRINAPLRMNLAPCVAVTGWVVVLLFCLLFQPLRARKNPGRPAALFVDEDFGYKNLPMVFEDSWFYLQRAWYGTGREYVMVIDRDAAEADPGWYTKVMERELKAFSPRYGKVRVLYFDQLPDWPNGFLAMDDDYTKTFEWLFAHHPELKKTLLGKHPLDPPIFGEERIYRVQKK